MSVNSVFFANDFTEVLSNYDLGEYQSSQPFSKGTVQTNLLVTTTKGSFAFRHYKNRTKESALFETNLIHYLKKKNYPCPAPIKDKKGKFVGIYKQKPFAFFEFIEGQHIENPNDSQKKQLIQKAAELQIVTRFYKATYSNYRLNYNIASCQKLAHEMSQKLDTDDARAKLKWFENQFSEIILPPHLPKGICHCDFHFSNVLYQNDKFVALLDFDDANYTYRIFDLVCLIDSWAWHHTKDFMVFDEAREIIDEYTEHRKLSISEKRHLFDLHKLLIMFDGIWYFERGESDNFYEKRGMVQVRLTNTHP
jgi:homoserine kinase type II